MKQQSWFFLKSQNESEGRYTEVNRKYALIGQKQITIFRSKGGDLFLTNESVFSIYLGLTPNNFALTFQKDPGLLLQNCILTMKNTQLLDENDTWTSIKDRWT